jgi:hypothetical protein
VNKPLRDDEIESLREGYWPIGMYGMGAPPGGIERLLATVDDLKRKLAACALHERERESLHETYTRTVEDSGVLLATVGDLNRRLAEAEAENVQLETFIRQLAAAAADLKASGEKAERDLSEVKAERDALADAAHDAWFDGWIACETAAGIDMSHVRAETYARRIRAARESDARKGEDG